jgi:hypothetical protein
MNRNWIILAGAALVLLGAAACLADEVFPVVHREPISVTVLDGRGGNPQAGVHVVLVAGYDRRDLDLGLWRQEAVTDATGSVPLSDALKNLPLLRIEVLKRGRCAADAGDAAFSVERVRRDGVSTPNRCGVVVAAEAPGVLSVFVKGKKPGAKAVPPAAERAAVQPTAPAEHPANKPAQNSPAPAPALNGVDVDPTLSESF